MQQKVCLIKTKSLVIAWLSAFTVHLTIVQRHDSNEQLVDMSHTKAKGAYSRQATDHTAGQLGHVSICVRHLVDYAC